MALMASVIFENPILLVILILHTPVNKGISELDFLNHKKNKFLCLNYLYSPRFENHVEHALESNDNNIHFF